VSELVIAMTFGGAVHFGGLSVWADVLTGGIDGITGEADHEGWFVGHCSVTNNATGLLSCEIDDRSSGFNRDFVVFVDDMANPTPTLLTADEPYIHLNAPVIGNVFFMLTAV
jgi:hypothetical protein